MLEFHGLNELIKTLEKAEKEVSEKAKETVSSNIKKVFEETQRRVPVRTEALKKSGRIEWGDETGNHISASIVYGDSEVDRIGVYYAAAVHEVLDAKHEVPTGPKYVELPIIEAKESFKKDIAKMAQKALGKKTL